MQGDVRFAVLGPVRAWRGGAELDLGHPRQRAVLAALLVREGAQATLEELIDGVWGDEAPATAAKVIRSYIYHLRLALGRDGTGHITSAGGGYTLDAGPQLDLAQFTGLAARARRAWATRPANRPRSSCGPASRAYPPPAVLMWPVPARPRASRSW